MPALSKVQNSFTKIANQSQKQPFSHHKSQNIVLSPRGN